MIMNLVQTTTLLIAIVFADITGAEEALSPLVISQAGSRSMFPRINLGPIWSRNWPSAHTFECTQTFLDTQVKELDRELDGELSRLRSEGPSTGAGLQKFTAHWSIFAVQSPVWPKVLKQTRRSMVGPPAWFPIVCYLK